MNDNAETKNSNLNGDHSIEVLAQLFKEQLQLLGRLILALRNMRPSTKPAPAGELMLEIAESDARVTDASLRPRVAYERDEEVAATD